MKKKLEEKKKNIEKLHWTKKEMHQEFWIFFVFNIQV